MSKVNSIAICFGTSQYCDIVMHCDVLLLEKVQKSFTKKLLGYEELSYKERLSKSGLKSLELTRLHADLIYYCYKILH